MGGLVAFTVVMVALALIFGAGAARKRQEERRKIAALLDGGTVEDSQIHGTYRDVPVAIHYRSSGSKHKSYWTWVDVPLPPGYPLALHVEPHGWFDQGKIERGEMVDLVVGVPAFDDAFLLEAAPAEVVRRMMTPPVLEFLIRHPRGALHTIEGGRLQLTMRGWVVDTNEMQHAVAAMTSLASSVRDATVAVDRSIPETPAADPYRGIPDDQPLRAARALRAAEVAQIDARRSQRALTGGFVLALVVVAVILILAQAAGR